MRRAIAGIIDGVSLSHLVPGGSYDISDSLGGYLVSTGDADAVPLSAGVTESNDDRSDCSVFGGVIVASPRESAPDRARPTRRRRSHPKKD
jgi:hypothetical protein